MAHYFDLKLLLFEIRTWENSHSHNSSTMQLTGTHILVTTKVFIVAIS